MTIQESQPMPDVVDFAYQIIDLKDENERLARRVEHLEDINKTLKESLDRSDNHTQEMTGIILNAALDPNSLINRGEAAIAKAAFVDEQREPPCSPK